MSVMNENFVTIHVKIEDVEVKQTVKLPYGKGNPIFNPGTVDSGVAEAAIEIRKMLAAHFGDRDTSAALGGEPAVAR
ncbi:MULTISPECIES: hypothetical protein [Rhodococcus]|uniref:hypothetical protein n=1 Tax=Rhodococcus TaxID=1827 RepID=UPI002953D4F9|nr:MULTISPECIES: hypothetical protein [Rhodococcus]MDV7244494.1 hypothetical protein [Rhodococcus oxybenzonivorans]MDV7274263.1 hypothetical protein [Rhodococcus oxybenzonivorans]MDV7337851.1 hypothetical protein [Rhodococcus oxybenzonivorans]MDV7345213.1 hypothetical protein [Rhodococcus oxybenzonivorans]MDV8028901.1 hypothetical protein [Rhodococcus sp. IEGM 27]